VWPKRGLRQVERQYGDKLDEVADFVPDFAAEIKAVGPNTYFESMAYNEREAKRDARAALEEPHIAGPAWELPGALRLGRRWRVRAVRLAAAVHGSENGGAEQAG
jgi:hypothetical protein